MVKILFSVIKQYLTGFPLRREIKTFHVIHFTLKYLEVKAFKES